VVPRWSPEWYEADARHVAERIAEMLRVDEFATEAERIAGEAAASPKAGALFDFKRQPPRRCRRRSFADMTNDEVWSFKCDARWCIDCRDKWADDWIADFLAVVPDRPTLGVIECEPGKAWTARTTKLRRGGYSWLGLPLQMRLAFTDDPAAPQMPFADAVALLRAGIETISDDRETRGNPAFGGAWGSCRDSALGALRENRDIEAEPEEQPQVRAWLTRCPNEAALIEAAEEMGGAVEHLTDDPAAMVHRYALHHLTALQRALVMARLGARTPEQMNRAARAAEIAATRRLNAMIVRVLRSNRDESAA